MNLCGPDDIDIGSVSGSQYKFESISKSQLFTHLEAQSGNSDPENAQNTKMVMPTIELEQRGFQEINSSSNDIPGCHDFDPLNYYAVADPQKINGMEEIITETQELKAISERQKPQTRRENLIKAESQQEKSKNEISQSKEMKPERNQEAEMREQRKKMEISIDPKLQKDKQPRSLPDPEEEEDTDKKMRWFGCHLCACCACAGAIAAFFARSK